ncbi:MAG: nucleotide disphospho-sugar-binding domain-containing protein [Nanoarchaeota archaeon]
MKILVTSMPGYGHLDWGGILNVLEELKERGHLVTIGSGNSLEDYIRSKGFNFLDIKIPPIKKFDPTGDIDKQVLEHMIEWFFDIDSITESVNLSRGYIQKEGIDLVISEPMYQGARFIGAVTNKPLCVMGADGKKQEIRNLKKPFSDLFEEFKRRIDKVSNNLGVSIMEHIAPRIYSDSLNLCFNTPEFENRLNEEAAPNCHYVGADAIIRKRLSDSKLRNFIERNRITLFATSGTIFHHKESDRIYQLIANELDVGLIVGRGYIIEELESTNILSMDMVDYDLIFPYMDVIVCHCGTGTMISAIRAGIPIFGLPVMRQQESNGSRINSYGNGIALDRSCMKENIILETLENLLTNECFSRRAVDLQKEFSRLGGYKRASDIIEGTYMGIRS